MSIQRTLETYLSDLLALRGKTVAETSYYPILERLLNALSNEQKLRIRAVVHPKSSGAGMPDFGLFDERQADGELPKAGVVEAKPLSGNVSAIGRSEQVKRYLNRYGQVLVTNYFQFLLVTRNEYGVPVFEERYSIAEDENDFWKQCATPRILASDHVQPLTEYLSRVLQRNNPLLDPKDVAALLASYARQASAILERRGKAFAEYSAIRHDFEESLGITFEGIKGDHFFRSTLVQTLFYGIFSAWVVWCESAPEPEQ